MKLTFILLTVAFLQVAANGNAQSVSYSGKNVDLEQVLTEIRKQTGFVFFYSTKDLESARPVSIVLKNVPVEEALQKIMADQPLTFIIRSNTVFIKSNLPVKENNGSVSIPRMIEVRGRLVDEKGEPVMATIGVQGTAIETITDNSGNFRLLNVDENAVLIISGINIETQIIRVQGRSDLSVIKLTTRVTSLNEVNVTINTGYQSIAKERSAGSFAKPDMDILRQRSTSMNVLQRLDGLVPGLAINSAPQSPNPILIRGLSTLATNRNPLYVVDGIQMEDISSINPQDVADITVLKDATAASIWGARASNGVIVITTKKGTVGEKIRVQYDGFINLQGRPDIEYIPVLTSQQFIQTAKEIFDPVLNPWNQVSGYTNLGSTGIAPHEMILYNQYRGLISAEQANKSLDSLASINNLHQINDLFYRNASIMNHTVSASGGGRVHSFYGSFSYTNNKSPRPGEKNNSYKVNLRQDFNVNKWLQLFLITDLTNTVTSSQRNPAIDNRFYPYQLFRDANGNNLPAHYVGFLSDSTRLAFQNRSRIDLGYVPLDEVNYGYTKSDALLNRITAGAKVNLFKGLRFEGVYGYIKGSNKTTIYDDAKSYAVRSELVQFTVAATPAVTPVYYLPNTGGRYSVINIYQKNWTVRNQLVYDNSWRERMHQLTVLAGQEAQEQFSVRNSSLTRGYNEDLQTFAPIDYASLGTIGVASPVMPNNAGRSLLPNNPFSQSELQTRFTSYYANAAYTYRKKYTVNGSWRNDQSNLFGLDKSAQNKPVWSAGMRWALSEEPFMKGVTWLTRLGVRATYGITGNSPAPGTASSYDILAAQNSNFLPNGTGLRIATAANPKLTWESTETINVGVDFAVLAGRMSGSVDVYNKETDNLLGNMPVNGFTGFNAIVGNFGSLKNSGIEVSLSSINIATRNFRWSTLVTLAYNKNKVTQLNSPVPLVTALQMITARYVTGYPALAVFGYDYAGLDSLGDPLINLGDKSVTKKPNVAMAGDVVYKGTSQPVWSGGISNTFSWKGFTLTANAIYNLGHVMRRDVGPAYFLGTTYAGRIINHGNIGGLTDQSGLAGGQLHPDFLNRWKKPGDEAVTNVPSYVANISVSTTRRDANYYRWADINVVSASFIKLRDITLAYALPRKILTRIRTESITLRMQISNIMLWKANDHNIDPEFHDGFFGRRVPSTPSVTDPSINTTSYRYGQGSVTFGMHVNF